MNTKLNVLFLRQPQEQDVETFQTAYISTFRIGDAFLFFLSEVKDGRADLLGGVEALQHSHTDLLWERGGRRDVARDCRRAIHAQHFIGVTWCHSCEREKNSLSWQSLLRGREKEHFC